MFDDQTGLRNRAGLHYLSYLFTYFAVKSPCMQYDVVDTDGQVISKDFLEWTSMHPTRCASL